MAPDDLRPPGACGGGGARQLINGYRSSMDRGCSVEEEEAETDRDEEETRADQWEGCPDLRGAGSAGGAPGLRVVGTGREPEVRNLGHIGVGVLTWESCVQREDSSNGGQEHAAPASCPWLHGRCSPRVSLEGALPWPVVRGPAGHTPRPSGRFWELE